MCYMGTEHAILWNCSHLDLAQPLLPKPKRAAPPAYVKFTPCLGRQTGQGRHNASQVCSQPRWFSLSHIQFSHCNRLREVANITRRKTKMGPRKLALFSSHYFL